MKKIIILLALFIVIGTFGFSYVSQSLFSSAIPTLSAWYFNNAGIITTRMPTNQVQIPSLGSSSSPCLSVNSAGLITTTSCGILTNSLSAVSPITYNTSTGSIGWTNSTGYLSSSTGANYFAPSSTVSSQWTSTSTGIYYNAGNVGIGTTAPGAKLEIQAAASKTGLIIRSATGSPSVASDGFAFYDYNGYKAVTIDTSDAFTAPSLIISGAPAFTGSRNYAYFNGYFGLQLAKFYPISWSNTDGGAAAALDSGLSRYGAGIVAVGNGTQGDYSGTLIAGNVGIGTTAPNANAILDVSSVTKAFMPPRMTTTQKNAIASPTAGMIVFDTTLMKLSVYTTTWETVTSL